MTSSRRSLVTAGAGAASAVTLTFDGEDTHRTVPVGVALFGGRHGIPIGTVLPSTRAATAPPALLAVLFRRAVRPGPAVGAVEG